MLNRLLFLLTLIVAGGLIGLMALAPDLVADFAQDAPPWLILFAEDAAIRRTTVACALGLVVTATLFFGRGAKSRHVMDRGRRSRSSNNIGA